MPLSVRIAIQMRYTLRSSTFNYSDKTHPTASFDAPSWPYNTTNAAERKTIQKKTPCLARKTSSRETAGWLCMRASPRWAAAWAGCFSSALFCIFSAHMKDCRVTLARSISMRRRSVYSSFSALSISFSSLVCNHRLGHIDYGQYLGLPTWVSLSLQ